MLLLLGGCGPEDEASRGAETAGSGGGAGAPVGGSGAGGAAGVSSGGATAGSNGAGTTAGGSSGSGVFGKAYPVLLEEMGYQMSGISLTGDELELYYARTASGSDVASVVRRTRPSKTEMFAPAEYLAPLAEACPADQYVNPDVTDDGLALYVTCTQRVELGMSEGVSSLRVARRPDRSSAFSLEAAPAGGVFASAGISADELTAYTDGEIFDTAPRMFKRASKAETFGEAQPVPGIDSPFRSPDISSDGLALYGAAAATSGGRSAIFRALRSDVNGAFATPVELILELDPLATQPGLGAPNITPSGTLYLIVVPPQAPYMVYAAAQQ